MADRNETHDTISTVLNRVLIESGRNGQEFTDDVRLSETDLDSLDIAAAVVSLEQELGVDPFRQGAAPVRTFGDLVELYVAASDGTSDD